MLPTVAGPVSAVAAEADEAVLDDLVEAARASAFFTLRAIRLQREAIAVLADAGVPALVLKGTALAQEAYGDAGARASADVDLLVPVADVRTAVTALRSAGLGWHGWRPKDDPDRAAPGPGAIDRLDRLPMLRDVTLVRDGVQVEIHWRLFENRRLLPVEASWFESPRMVECSGVATPTLPLGVHWRYVHLHGAAHRWSLLKWLADVPALALRRPELVSGGALNAVPKAERRAVAAGLIVAESVFGRFLPATARSWAEQTAGTRFLRSAAERAVRAEEDPPRQVTPRTLGTELTTRLSLRTDPAYRLEELRLILLGAGRAQAVEDPAAAELVLGPARWARRTLRRRVRTRSRRR